MKNLITSIASIILFSICLLQFIASETTYLRLVNVGQVITNCVRTCEKDECATIIAKKLNEFEYIDHVEVTESNKKTEITYFIKDVVGPANALKVDSNIGSFTNVIYWETS